MLFLRFQLYNDNDARILLLVFFLLQTLNIPLNCFMKFPIYAKFDKYDIVNYVYASIYWSVSYILTSHFQNIP